MPGFAAVVQIGEGQPRCRRPPDRPQHGARDEGVRPDPGARPGAHARGGHSAEIRGNLDVTAAYLGESAVARVSTPMLELSGLEVSYGSLRRCAGLADSARSAGEIVGLIGPNGAGKSTTLHAIMGLDPAGGGRRAPRGRVAPAAASPRRSREPGSRSFRRAADLRRPDGGGEPPARPRGPARQRRRAAQEAQRPVSGPGGSSAAPAGGALSGSSSSGSRSPAPSWPGPTCSCSTSRRSASHRRSSTPSSPPSPGSASAASRAARRAARAANGRARRPHARPDERRAADSPDPGRRGRHRKMIPRTWR